MAVRPELLQDSLPLLRCSAGGRDPPSGTMAPHLDPKEMDLLRAWFGDQGSSPTAAHAKLTQARAKRGIAAPNITNVRKFLRGLTYKASTTEQRGRKTRLTRSHVLTMNRTRIRLIEDPKIGGQREVHWNEIIQKSNVPQVHRTTAQRAFAREGIDVKWRRPREKPLRKAEHVEERKLICGRWRFLSDSYFADSMDLVIDNKSWDYPADERARNYLRRQRIRGHLRTPAEGLKAGFTKPNKKRHRINPGGSVMVCAGIIKCRVAVWHYVNKRWNGEAAASTYRDVLAPKLQTKVGPKRKYRVLEDNDPTGYKSRKATEQKVESRIHAMQYPRYSPDLNPWDFSLWEDIQGRMDQNAPKGKETKAAFKQRLRRTAMSTSTQTVRRALLSIKKRAQAIFDADGGDIDFD